MLRTVRKMKRNNSHNSIRGWFFFLPIIVVCWTSVVLAARPGWLRQEVNWPMTGGASVEAVNFPEGKAPQLLFKQTDNLTKRPSKDTTQKESASQSTSLTTQLTPLINANIIDSPALGGFLSWCMVTFTDERSGRRVQCLNRCERPNRTIDFAHRDWNTSFSLLGRCLPQRPTYQYHP